MRRIALLSSILLAACAAAEPPVHGETPGRTCNTAGAARFIGQQGTSEAGASIMRATNSSVLRWAPPGTVLTMDYSPSRVTVRLEINNRIISINCG